MERKGPDDTLCLSKMIWICPKFEGIFSLYPALIILNKLISGQNVNCSSKYSFVCLYWGFMAQSTQWGHVKHGQFT